MAVSPDARFVDAPTRTARRVWLMLVVAAVFTGGWVYLISGVVPAALAAVPVALLSGHLLTEISLTVAAALWLITAGSPFARPADATTPPTGTG